MVGQRCYLAKKNAVFVYTKKEWVLDLSQGCFMLIADLFNFCYSQNVKQRTWMTEKKEEGQ